MKIAFRLAPVAAAGLALLLASASAPAQTATPLGPFGSQGTGDGQFDLPYGVALDRVSGRIYVTDYQYTLSRVQRFSRDGTFELKWGGPGNGNSQFSTPTGIAADPARNRVYVADFSNNRVGVFDLDGNFVTQWTNSDAGNYGIPRDVSVLDRTGDVYITGTLGVQRVRFVDGSYLGAFGGSGAADGQFGNQGAYDLGINQTTGQVYAVDYSNRRVQRFNFGGGFELKWGTFGTGPGEFGAPLGTAVDAAGHVYVSDAGNDRIQRFTADGVFEFAFGGPGSGPDQFSQPTGLAISDDGILYVADYGNHRISRWQITEPVPPAPAAPKLTISGKKTLKTAKATYPMKGTATGTVTSVTYKIGQKSGKASGTSPWKFTVKLKPGKNVITVTATGPGGSSAPAKITVTRTE